MARQLPPSKRPSPVVAPRRSNSVGVDPTLVPLNLREALEVLSRRSWLIAGIAALSIPLALYVWLTSVPQYEAEAVVRLADTREAVTGGLVAPPPAGIGRAVDPLQTEAGVITSRAMIGEVVDSNPSLRLSSGDMPLGVIEDVELFSADLRDTIAFQFGTDGFVAEAGEARVQAAYGAPVEVSGVRFSVQAVADAETGTLYVADREQAVSRLLRGLKATPRDETDIIDISYTGPDPDRARLVANRVAETYRMANTRDAQQQARVQRQFLESQIQISDSLLEMAQRDLTGFRSTAGTYRRQRPGADLADLRIRRDEANAERQRYRSLLTRLQSTSREARRQTLQSAMALRDVAGTVEAAELNRQLVAYELRRDSLVTRRPTTSPDVVRVEELIATTEARLVGAVETALRSLIATTDARVATLEDFGARTDANLRQESQTEAQEAWLQKQIETASSMSEQLREQLRRAQLAERLEVGQVQILDPAVEAVPVGIGLLRKVLLILVLGLSGGVAAAFVAEHFNSSIQSQIEISSLGLPVLGVVPRLKDGAAMKKASSPVIEALRGVRLNLVYAHGTAGSLLATITSPSKGDGKSFVASNLALAFAYAGHQTLLVDGDVRRGVLHDLLGQRRKPGLTDLLVGRVPRDQVIQQTHFPRLDFLASGIRTSQAPEFLGSPSMTQLIMSLRSSYGVILVDSPPLGAGVDALSLGAVTGSMLLVLRAGATDRASTEAKLDLVQRLPIRVLGCVVNAVREDDVEQYDSYYMEGYELEDEEEHLARVVQGHRRQGHGLSSGRKRRR